MGVHSGNYIGYVARITLVGCEHGTPWDQSRTAALMDVFPLQSSCSSAVSRPNDGPNCLS